MVIPGETGVHNIGKQNDAWGPLLPLEASQTLTKTPSKSRSFSDSTPKLEPSPRFRDFSERSRNDNDLTPNKNGASASRGLSLQTSSEGTGDLNFTNFSANNRGPHPLHNEQWDTCGSTSNVLPRRSRGMDFSRACTNLHHSTLVDHSSPDSSPTITHKSMKIPSRRASTHSMVLDSPRVSLSWTPSGNTIGDKLAFIKGGGMNTALTLDSSSNSSDNDDVMMRHEEQDDTMVTTPQVRKFESGSAVTPFGLPRGSTGEKWGSLSPLFSNSRRSQSRMQGEKSGNSSDSFDSFPFVKRTESQAGTFESSFGYDVPMDSPISRRESLSLGTNGLHISTSNESGDEGGTTIGLRTPGVVRRPVTRRSNLLPKTKGFARIRAALQEESCPVDSDAKREAEVIRQVQGSYDRCNHMSTATSSPDLMPSICTLPFEEPENLDTDALGLRTITNTGVLDAGKGLNSIEFRSNIHNSRLQTPPPPLFRNKTSSSGPSEDMALNSPSVSTPPSSVISTVSVGVPNCKNDAEHELSATFYPPSLPLAADVTRKIAKRRREEDFDTSSIKRRAVSPGLSFHGSPTISQSPVSSNGGWWGQGKPRRDDSCGSAEDRSTSNGSITYATPTLGLRRVGLQGMTDTNDAYDGMMKMSIE